MTLAFSTQLNGKPTNFVEKIIFGLEQNKLIDWNELGHLLGDYYNRFTSYFEGTITNTFSPKIHTMRVDEHDRWKAGTLIHFVINNRTPSRYQFAPVLKCVSTQKVVIKYWYNPQTEKFDDPDVYVDNKLLNFTQVTELAINDGFESVIDFLAYFNTDWSGKLIHWTNKKY